MSKSIWLAIAAAFSLTGRAEAGELARICVAFDPQPPTPAVLVSAGLLLREQDEIDFLFSKINLALVRQFGEVPEDFDGDIKKLPPSLMLTVEQKFSSATPLELVPTSASVAYAAWAGPCPVRRMRLQIDGETRLDYLLPDDGQSCIDQSPPKMAEDEAKSLARAVLAAQRLNLTASGRDGAVLAQAEWRPPSQADLAVAYGRAIETAKAGDPASSKCIGSRSDAAGSAKAP